MWHWWLQFNVLYSPLIVLVLESGISTWVQSGFRCLPNNEFTCIIPSLLLHNRCNHLPLQSPFPLLAGLSTMGSFSSYNFIVIYILNYDIITTKPEINLVSTLPPPKREKRQFFNVENFVIDNEVTFININYLCWCSFLSFLAESWNTISTHLLLTILSTGM